MPDDKLARRVRIPDEILPPEKYTFHVVDSCSISVLRFIDPLPDILEPFREFEFSVMELEARNLSVETIRARLPYPWTLVFKPKTLTYRLVKL